MELTEIKNTDVLDIRIRRKTEIEAFVLIHTLGLLEALEKGIMTTANCKKSIFTTDMVKTLQGLHVDNRIQRLIYQGIHLKCAERPLNKEVLKNVLEMREEALSLLTELMLKSTK